MKQKKEWIYKEYNIPCTMDPWQFAKMCGQKPRPLTKQEQEIWNEAQKMLAEARKWKKPNH